MASPLYKKKTYIRERERKSLFYIFYTTMYLKAKLKKKVKMKGELTFWMSINHYRS